MSGPQLPGKRVLVVGAETAVGRAVAAALAEASARLAVVAATPDAEAAFSVQRLARRLGAIAQAIDATNEAAVRVMMRQVAKQLGGLDTVVVLTIPFGADSETRERGLAAAQLVVKFANKELTLRGGGVLIAVDPVWAHPDPLRVLLEFGITDFKKRWPVSVIAAKDLSLDAVVAETLCAVAGTVDNR